MSEEILINVTPQETRVALVENGMLQEVYIERERRRGLVGNICKGRVSRVLPGMEAAFVDVGLERTAFLHASDVNALAGEERANGEVTGSISQLLRAGQEVLVQVVKDPLGTKGARLTTYITVPSRYLVFIPDAHNVGVSQKIEDEAERARLREIVRGCLGESESGGFIVRTAAEAAGAEAIRADMEFLRKLLGSIQERARHAPAGAVVHEDLPLALRVLRDLAATQVEKVRIDSRQTFERALHFAAQFVPEISGRIEYYSGERPIFDLYGVEDEIHKALQRRVDLKSGGYLIIDQPEAMTTIDVNTG
ncbi:MAG TPA: Rne/Rng family ribonuclease, partial [Chromatiales bacterium]|nr:Rne/Rng family ribonuclease [Chromatiales bacterium]